ncbi:MAG: VOC family protein [Gammaproteobacteria bacterium]|nr:VOC family protein [Gammaproteobacteria bacterium]
MAEDQRPAFAIGHMRLGVEDVPTAYSFFVRHGMRGILERDNFAILELRGGTHLILNEAEAAIPEGERAPFDLMVDDIDEAHRRFIEDGTEATTIERGNIHDSFAVKGPSGYSIPINSSHVAGIV